MANMLAKGANRGTCGYVCQCGSYLHPGVNSKVRRAVKKQQRARERRAWIRDYNKEN